MPGDDRGLYSRRQEEEYRLHEAKCLRCGACCGALDGDPCAMLVKDGQGKYACRDYANRLGPQKTVSGKIFTCVDIREVMKFDPPHPLCAYA